MKPTTSKTYKASSELSFIEAWFKKRSWKPYDFQRETWQAYLEGHDGMILVPTGSGKTYASFWGPISEMALHPTDKVQVIYITPLKAVSRDIEKAVRLPIEELGLDITVESRTGDTSSGKKRQQLEKLPNILITTPESLSILLSHPGAVKQLSHLKALIVDEWHELMSSKRGSLAELSFSRLRSLAFELRVWGISATIGNIEEAAQCVVGLDRKPVVVRSKIKRPIEIETLVPKRIERFPWAGHMGLSLLDDLLEKIDIDKTCLLFTNTRFQSETWYQAILRKKPEWQDRLALHHSSINKEEREEIENDLKEGELGLVVCTSSLDLGVDFSPVGKVIQVGSPKGVARLLQRAGRAAHRPGATAELLFVPTHAFEIVEIVAVKKAIADGVMESRPPLLKPMDVLVQHLMTSACGAPLRKSQAFAEVKSSYSFSSLTKKEFDWAFNYLEKGGDALTAYPQYQRLAKTKTGYKPANRETVFNHRMSIGTITSYDLIAVHLQTGGKVGDIEESFVSGLKKGDVFTFAGRTLELIRIKDMKAVVKLAKRKSTRIPSWAGSQFPISASLSNELREQLGSQSDLPEWKALSPVLKAQSEISAVPPKDELLIELLSNREGRHLFVYPFEGRQVHEGLSAILALRLARQKSTSFSISANDYGIELLAPKEYDFESLVSRELFSPTDLEEDLFSSINQAELAKRQFRSIAQISGLISSGFPSAKKARRHLQASSSLFFEVFTKHDPSNLLLKQAEHEVLRGPLEGERLRACMERIKGQNLKVIELNRPSPLGFPLMVEMWNAKLSTESVLDRIHRLTAEWNAI